MLFNSYIFIFLFLPLCLLGFYLGISFFTFQQISFIVDPYNGETKDYSFTEYALFVCFFSQLIAGPIVLHREIIPQFRNPAVYKKNIIYSGDIDPHATQYANLEVLYVHNDIHKWSRPVIE